MKCRHCPTVLNDATWYPVHRKTRRRICKTCHTHRGPENHAERQRRYRNEFKRRDPEGFRKMARLRRVKHHYGLTPDQLHDLYTKQDGRCAICREPEGEKSFCVDHDHDTGIVRGLLCGNCNHLIGHARESLVILRQAIAYLIDPPAN